MRMLNRCGSSSASLQLKSPINQHVKDMQPLHFHYKKGSPSTLINTTTTNTKFHLIKTHTLNSHQMAMKAALAAALLVALVVAASASSYTTIITTTSYDEEGSQQGRGQSQQCSQQVQGREFQSCQRYLRREQRGNRREQEEEYGADQCCNELKEMDRYQCGCEALRQAVQKAQHGGSSYQGRGQGHQSQGEQIYQRARALPRVCNLSQQQCRLNLVFV